ncbi:MAG: GNAT family N-acetyltransferase, partial [Rhodothermales bacterium]
MIKFERCDVAAIQEMKADYLKSLIAPMDGMWEVGFINPGPHWEIRFNGNSAGYYAANEEGVLLQFYVRPAFEQHGRSLFDTIIAQKAITKATVSTIDPIFLSLSLDVQKKIVVHTYLYESQSAAQPSQDKDEVTNFRLLLANELSPTIAFQQECLQSDQDLSGWLEGYSSNLIARKELFVLSQDNAWIGLGEYRKSDSQKGIVDLGVMVSPAFRGKGWAAYILSRLHARCNDLGCHAICSTTIDNAGA